MKPLSYIEVSRERLQTNVEAIRRFIDSSVGLVAVVKANAYGHGLTEVVKSVEDHVDYFQVDDIDELRRLRAISQAPTLVLGYIQSIDLAEAIALGCELALYDEVQLAHLVRLNQSVSVHIAVDACLGREGVVLSRLESLLKAIKEVPCVQVAGMYGHFANLEDTSDRSHAKKQIETYNSAKQLLKECGFEQVKTHISATSGILAHDQRGKENALVRLGIGMYGLWPSEELRKEYEEDVRLQPTLRWVTHNAQVKELPTNNNNGYGLTYTTATPEKVALVPQGYSDGYDRALSNVGQVLIRGTRCHIRGRVAMNMMVVDVSHLPEVSTEDEVVLLGRQGEERISAEELASLSATINYEVVARISALLPRILT